MTFLGRRTILLSFYILAISASAFAQATKPDAAAFQKKAGDAQVKINANENDRDLLKKATKLNDVALAKQVLLRNGFTADDLENAKIILLSGGGKGGKDEIEISANCCETKEITIK